MVVLAYTVVPDQRHGRLSDVSVAWNPFMNYTSPKLQSRLLSRSRALSAADTSSSVSAYTPLAYNSNMVMVPQRTACETMYQPDSF